MIDVTFDEAFAAIRHRLKAHQIASISPTARWTRIGKTYIALREIEPGRIWVDWVFSGGDAWFRELVRDLKAAGYDDVGFETETGSGVESFCRYYGGRPWHFGFTNRAGKDITTCFVSLKENRRLK